MDIRKEARKRALEDLREVMRHAEIERLKARKAKKAAPPPAPDKPRDEAGRFCCVDETPEQETVEPEPTETE